MKLKQIEMQGFKSFAEKTKIEFPKGLTVVIGPNGSGKSNISDAVRWVLGEMSLKTLRGSKMEDVIFNGTAKRQPANYSAVSLYLDTSEEYVNRAPGSEEQQAQDRIRLSDAPEVIVTRRYYRTGDSEYYINKKQVRLKDIYELFFDTGIGREGYSVIGQGKIAEVLSAKGDERRSIFEEASGISKFRNRKTEAERKLRDTEANLLRINDIVGELASRIGPLEKDAQNAKKFLELSEEKKGLEITLWLERTDKIRSELGLREQNLAAAKLELELAEEEIRSIENKQELSDREGYTLLKNKSEAENEISLAKTAASEAQGKKAVAENEINHLKTKIQDTKADISALERSLEESEQTVSRLEIKFKQAAGNALSGEQTKIRLADEYNSALYSLNEANKEIEALSASVSEQVYAVSELEIKKAGISARMELASGDSDNQRLVASRERVSQLQGECDGAKGQLDVAVSDYESVRASTKASEEELRVLNSKKDEIDGEISAQKVSCASAEQKREGLLRLESLFDGYSGAVKTVMTASKSGRIKTPKGNVNIHGTVASLLSADGEYVVALETALGASVQFVVVESEADAKASIAYLKSINGGRATFLPLDTVNGRLCDVSQIKNMKGYVGIAGQLALCDDKYKGVANELLGRTVIASDIDCASAIAKQCGYRIRIVTKDGQVINAGGSYTGGSAAQKVGVFTRGVDIERLDAEIKEANTKLFELETKKRQITRKIEEITKSMAENQEDMDGLSAICNEKRGVFEGIIARLEEEKARLSELESGMEDMARTRAENEKQLEEITCQIEEAKALQTDSESKIHGLREELPVLKKAESDALDALNTFKLEEVKLNAAAQSVKERLDSENSKIAELSARLELASSLLSESEAEIVSLGDEIARLEDEISSNQDKVEKYTEIKAQIDVRYAEKEKYDADLKSASREASTRRDQAFKTFTGLESGVESQHKEYDTLISKLWDEYELTYTEAEKFRLPPEKTVKAQTRINYLKSQIKALGHINVNAVAEYAETKERYDFLTAQLDDLNKTRRSIDATIARLNSQMRTTFVETIEKIDAAFSEVFTELFGGGQGHIQLQDPEAPLECGIDIIIKPPGKSVKSISLLSGGEQSFAAIALYIALQQINPAPFCIFDEIESALDDVNLVRFVDYVKRRCEKTQYIMITHRRGTMERADTIYGVTMHEKGVSDYIKLDISKVEKYVSNE